MEISGDHRTDCVNRAIWFYSYLLENVFLQDRELYTANKKGGKVKKMNVQWTVVEYGNDNTT